MVDHPACRLLHLIILCMICGIVAVRPAAGQAPPPPESAHESEAETVAKAVKDLRSASVDDRKRAVLVLSKYRHPAAVQAVLQALRDPDAQIRQSALVAIVENRQFAEAGEHFILMLEDENVHIRRIVSTFLQQALLMQRIGFPGLPPEASGALSPPARQAVRQAFRDSDATVRKNMLRHFTLLSRYLDVEAVLPLLEDKDRDIRMLALEQAVMLVAGDPRRLIAVTTPLIEDPDSIIRLQLAQNLGRLPLQITREPLLKLAKDDDFAVATEAQLALLQQGDAHFLEQLLAALDDHRMRHENAERIIESLDRIGDPGKQALRRLLEHRNTRYRLAALKSFGRRHPGEIKFEQLWSLLDDSFAPVRQEAGMLVMMMPPDQRPDNMLDWIRKLISSRHGDVRELAVTLAAMQPRNKAGDLLMELLLDESPGVRGKAIHYVVAHRLPEWPEIVKISMDDESSTVRLETAQALLNSPSPETQQLLREIFQTTTDEAVKNRIAQRMSF